MRLRGRISCLGLERDAAWLFLTVFIVLTGFHQFLKELSSQQVTLSNVYRPRTRPCRTASISFHSHTALVPYWGGISLNSAILFTEGPTTFPSFSCFGFIVISAGRGSFAIFHWTLQCFSLQSQLLPPRREHGSLPWESRLIPNWLAETAHYDNILEGSYYWQL